MHSYLGLLHLLGEHSLLSACNSLLSHVQLFVTPSMEFSRPEYWNGQPFPSPGDLTNPGIEPRSPALQADSEDEMVGCHHQLNGHEFE